MKELKINVPKGYEIDKDKSTFDSIVFKEISKLPSSWEELDLTNGYCCDHYSHILHLQDEEIGRESKNLFKTEEQAEASIALAQLSQLRYVYRQGWEPDWEFDLAKFVVGFHYNKLKVKNSYNTHYFLSFQDKKTAELFLKNFKDLIEKAKPLIN